MVALVVVALFTPQAPDSKASGQTVLAFYTRHHTSSNVAALCLAYAGAMCGAFVAPWCCDWLGSPATMAIGALICALAAFVTLHVIRKREAQLGLAPR